MTDIDWPAYLKSLVTLAPPRDRKTEPLKVHLSDYQIIKARRDAISNYLEESRANIEIIYHL